MGPEGRGQHRLPQGARGGGRCRRGARRADRRLQRALRQPYIAAERGYVDDVIEPRATRPVLDRRARDGADEARAAPASTGTFLCSGASAASRSRRARRDCAEPRGGGGRCARTRDDRAAPSRHTAAPAAAEWPDSATAPHQGSRMAAQRRRDDQCEARVVQARHPGPKTARRGGPPVLRHVLTTLTPRRRSRARSLKRCRLHGSLELAEVARVASRSRAPHSASQAGPRATELARTTRRPPSQPGNTPSPNGAKTSSHHHEELVGDRARIVGDEVTGPSGSSEPGPRRTSPSSSPR